MPTFPTYDGELPQCLNLLNPRHYLLVLYWVFFRPTALKCYLYQANLKTYGNGKTDLENLFNEPVSRNFIIIGFLSANFVIFSIVCFFYLFNTINQCNFVGHSAHFYGLLTAIDIHELSNALAWEFSSIFTWTVLGAIFATVSLSSILAFLLANEGTNGIAFSISVGLLFFPITGIVFCDSTGEAFIVIYYLFLGLSLSAVRLNWESSIALIFMITLFLFSILLYCIAFPSEENAVRYLFPCMAILIGVFRVPFFLLELANLFLFQSKENIHPIEWDELSVLPLPLTSQYLIHQLQLNELRGLNKISQIARSRFQMRAVQDSMWSYLEEMKSPIEAIYCWFNSRWLDQYASGHLKFAGLQYSFPGQVMLFCDLAHAKNRISIETSSQTFLIDFTTDELNCSPPNNLIVLVTLLLAVLERCNTSLEESAKRLDLGIQALIKDVELDGFFNDYKYGAELYKSLFAISTYLQFQTPQQITTAPTHLTWINPTDIFLRPTVIQALQTLSTISQSVHRANIASSPINQRNAILIANDSLQQLSTYVTEQVHPNYPEQKLLLRIIDQWQSIITKAGGELGRAELLEPIENPYIAGPPVTGNLFVGREDILTQLEELWLRPGQVESVVLYGHRRMGKTSILRNLPGRLTPTTRIINFNIQTLGTLNTAQLILALAQTLYDDLPIHIHIHEPTAADFPTPEPDFRRWLKKLEPHRNEDDRFIIAIDEFELIEQGIRDGRLSPSLIAHWRGILNDFPWIIFAFAGLHTLQEMTQDYWNPLFGSVKKISITFLTQPAATRLITNPSEDFPIDYDSDAIDLIYHLTHGQPYLTQLICQNLITRFNRQRFEEQREIEPRFTMSDVQTIITEPNFFNDGNAYFRGIWEQAQETQGTTQLAILRQLVDRPRFITELPPAEDLEQAIALLLEHDVIQETDGKYTYRVELMRQWVDQQNPSASQIAHDIRIPTPPSATPPSGGQ